MPQKRVHCVGEIRLAPATPKKKKYIYIYIYIYISDWICKNIPLEDVFFFKWTTLEAFLKDLKGLKFTQKRSEMEKEERGERKKDWRT